MDSLVRAGLELTSETNVSWGQNVAVRGLEVREALEPQALGGDMIV